jgi:hypothetical protein
MPLINGGTPGDSVKELQAKLWPTLIVNWKLWPAVQLMNFIFIPVKL